MASAAAILILWRHKNNQARRAWLLLFFVAAKIRIAARSPRPSCQMGDRPGCHLKNVRRTPYLIIVYHNYQRSSAVQNLFPSCTSWLKKTCGGF